jgi:hypothetical protein
VLPRVGAFLYLREVLRVCQDCSPRYF